jgi:hypothetical protein
MGIELLEGRNTNYTVVFSRLADQNVGSMRMGES